jgi:polyhydroxyalkanoate synthesis regulator phasin
VPESSRTQREAGVTEALRSAIERTLALAGQARPGSAALRAERASRLLDDVVKRGRDARGELARRGQEAGAELARRGQGAAGEVAERIEAVERRLARLEATLRGITSNPKPKD